MRRDFELLYGNLSIGRHNFEFQLESEFFKNGGANLVEGGDVSVLLIVDRTNSHMDLEFTLKGTLLTSCDKCLSELVYPVDNTYYLHVKFAENSRLDGDEIVYLSFNEYKLDLESHLYDFALLSLPMRRICADSINRESCEADVLDKMIDPKTESPDVHPELEKLKGLFTKE